MTMITRTRTDFVNQSHEARAVVLSAFVGVGFAWPSR